MNFFRRYIVFVFSIIGIIQYSLYIVLFCISFCIKSQVKFIFPPNRTTVVFLIHRDLVLGNLNRSLAPEREIGGLAGSKTLASLECW